MHQGVRGLGSTRGAVLALLLLSQTGCIVSFLAGELLGDDEACASQRWSFEGGESFDSMSACEEQAGETQTCACEADVAAEPAT